MDDKTIRRYEFGRLSTGNAVMAFELKNAKGESVTLLDYGATIHSVLVLDDKGQLGDVVLGAPDAPALEAYSFAGSVMGRVANRIAFGRYTLDGVEHQLECNMGGHFLHGASGAYAHRLFSATALPEENAVQFTLQDNGEGGFDNDVDVKVKYTFTDDSELRIEYLMIPQEDTLLCPTNHAYFNLSDGDVRALELMIDAQRIAVKSADGVPDGLVSFVQGTERDFTQIRPIGAMDKPVKFDDFFLLEQDRPVAAVLQCPENGRRMTVTTDMPCLVLFTPFAKSRAGKNGAIHDGYCTVCLETQFVPNAINCEGFRKPIFRKGEALVSKTSYQFSVYK